MIVTNQTTQDLYFGPLHLVAGVGQQLTIDDTSATSLYLLSDSVADAVNNAYNAGKITVSGQAQPFPRPTGTPQLLHGDGSPEGLVFAPQGSIYMRRDAASTYVLYVKTTGITLNTGWVAVDTTGASVPTGTITQFAAASAPTGWLVCDGSAVSRTTYAALFGVISTSYGSGDGSTTFNVPDLRGRVGVGYAASGGRSEVSTLGNNEGVALANRRPQHRHTPHHHAPLGWRNSSGNSFANNSTPAHTLFFPNASNNDTGVDSTTSVDGGSGNANDSLDTPAYLVVSYIIKT